MDRLRYKENAMELRRITGQSLVVEFAKGAGIATEIALIELDKNENIDPAWVLGHVFQAGKIEGIRKERARRK